MYRYVAAVSVRTKLINKQVPSWLNLGSAARVARVFALLAAHGRTLNSGTPQVPVPPLKAIFAGNLGFNSADSRTAWVINVYTQPLDLFEFLVGSVALQGVAHSCSARAVFALKHSIALKANAVGLRKNPMVGVGSIIGGEHAAFGGGSFADRAQVVQNPSGPTKGSEHEVAFAFLYCNVLHGHYRKACPALPCFSGVAAHKKPCFGAQVNQ